MHLRKRGDKEVGKKEHHQDDYVTVRIPRQLANEIDKIIQSGTLGYKTRAEMAKEAIRLRIMDLEKRR